MKDIIIVLLIIIVIIMSGASFKKYVDRSPDSQLKAYVIDDLHYIIGFGKWDNTDGTKFKIQSVRGQNWEIYPEAKIDVFEVTPDFIAKQTK